MTTDHTPTPEGAHQPTEAPTTREQKRLPIPETRREAHELQRLRDERGSAFDAYLGHVWTSTAIQDMEAEFENLYWASYDNLRHFADDFIESLGWNEARKQLLRDWTIPSDVLIWDHDAFIRNLSRDFEFIERDGVTHVFIA